MYCKPSPDPASNDLDDLEALMENLIRFYGQKSEMQSHNEGLRKQFKYLAEAKHGEPVRFFFMSLRMFRIAILGYIKKVETLF